ncbi:MAG: hypothetical protein A3I77_00210 [Gammaproteobacteria bacterium RIFCSPLOWO2_02_FULL_42_14]|nr:MAG: hypothetical protein A3B71_04315 [Gammaproteobacteria bacterium RIFCSPHIGHO2_02_FULL_42_43]OGT29368.1 MAG: hypothetical protein A2624_02285 [Gammaproteobacteria bacterium RIFCSPHIGHO2_01_FULL_42_8]OGT50890.1 MAG: hypothetical protein A3E54_03915 [Gammaproteobacteria bacterium RIFCSPHIGHO2_12_FULL_41_25]OGT62829.1 MAG: hypothetical protein A3I77_00210 [Gammaproteobacteria bacterium RIFCSPLOWO2_02_FULL_42_14]OGT86787.1 MAG: hypothetical protein A3G86_03095 [Gammaproteobacteria bacterium R
MQTPHHDNDDPQPLSQILGRNSLGQLIQKAHQLRAIEKALKPILPTEFAKSCYVLNIDQRKIILGVANAAIATHMQMITGEIIQILQKIPEFQQFQTIQCRVRTQK